MQAAAFCIRVTKNECTFLWSRTLTNGILNQTHPSVDCTERSIQMTAALPAELHWWVRLLLSNAGRLIHLQSLGILHNKYILLSSTWNTEVQYQRAMKCVLFYQVHPATERRWSLPWILQWFASKNFKMTCMVSSPPLHWATYIAGPIACNVRKLFWLVWALP